MKVQGSLEGEEGSAASPPPVRNRVHSRKNIGNQLGPSFTGEGWDPSTAKETARLQDPAGLGDMGPDWEISMEEAKQTREIPGESNMTLYPERNFWKCSNPPPFLPHPLCAGPLAEGADSEWFEKPKVPSIWPRKLLWWARLTDCPTECSFAYLASAFYP